MKNILKHKTLPCIFLALAVIGCVFFYSGRFSWVFINITVGLEAFTYCLFYLMIATIIIMTALSVISLKEKPFGKTKVFKVIKAIFSFLSFVFFIAGLVSMFSVAGKESSDVYFHYLKSSLKDAAFFILVPLLAVFLPLLKDKARNAVTALSLIITLIVGVFVLFPTVPHKITCDPTVIDTGDGYSIVFSTSDYATGYVEYTYNEKQYKVYDQTGGRLNSDSKIHSIKVPYEHLENNSYSVGSLQVFEQYSYGSHTGKEVKSQKYTFSPPDADNITCLVVSDWHTYTDKAYAAASHIGEYDAVILMGDSTPGVDFEAEVIKNTVEFAGELSGGTKPVIYVRGNHETRGAYAGKLMTSLGLDSFYYTTSLGNYSFIALDSGEDKDDSHPEYGSMTDYNTYRADMIKWLEGTEIENDKVIALSHSWKISDVEKELSQKGWNEIDRLGARLMISGHTHHCRLIGETDDEKAFLSAYPDIVGYMDGGNQKQQYIASKMTLSPESIYLEAFTDSGEKVFDHSIAW